jgi:hypothetical protein
MNIFVDSEMDEAARRQELYGGAVFVYRPSEIALKFCRLAQEMIQEAFHPFDPLRVHESLPAEKCAEILAVLKPKFIHHPLSKKCIQGMLAEAGYDLAKTYFDVPRMRTAFPGDYLKSGIAYAFHPHRDTWYSAPLCQINWWMPIYELNSENCMALHPHYFDRAIRNGSSQYDYQRWNEESRFNAARHVQSDTRVQPHAEEPIDLDPQIRMVCPAGGAYTFSAAHLHSTVPNTSKSTRYSIDFRIVHLDDVLSFSGARNLDSACTGTTMGDYLRGTDYAHLPEEVISMYKHGRQVDDAVSERVAPV